MATELDARELERTVKAVYRTVATAPDEPSPVEMGHEVAERLGYPPAELDRVPSEAIDSFVGVGYHLDLAAIAPGDRVLDLGSGSGLDAFLAALYAGSTGQVTGLDMTIEQVTMARQLRDQGGFDTVTFEQGYIEELPFENDAFDVVLANGTITLSARKHQTLQEACRVVAPYGRLAISELVAEEELPVPIRTDAELWAAGVGGAMDATAYLDAIEDAGFEVIVLRENPEYEGRTDRIRDLCRRYGVKSASLSARKRDKK